VGQSVTLASHTTYPISSGIRLKIADMTRKQSNGLNVVIVDCAAPSCARRVYSNRALTVTFQAFVYDTTKRPGQAGRILAISPTVTVNWGSGFAVGLTATVPLPGSVIGGGGAPGEIGTVARLPVGKELLLRATTGHVLSHQFHLRIGEVVRNVGKPGWHSIAVRADCASLPCEAKYSLFIPRTKYYIAAVVDMTIPVNHAGRIVGKSPILQVTWYPEQPKFSITLRQAAGPLKTILVTATANRDTTNTDFDIKVNEGGPSGFVFNTCELTCTLTFPFTQAPGSGPCFTGGGVCVIQAFVRERGTHGTDGIVASSNILTITLK
jgi:hypothetical protein